MTRDEVKVFWTRYFALASYRAKVDAFAQECGYDNAVDVPKEDYATFIEMFQDHRSKERD